MSETYVTPSSGCVFCDMGIEPHERGDGLLWHHVPHDVPERVVDFVPSDEPVVDRVLCTKPKDTPK